MVDGCFEFVAEGGVSAGSDVNEEQDYCFGKGAHDVVTGPLLDALVDEFNGQVGVSRGDVAHEPSL